VAPAKRVVAVMLVCTKPGQMALTPMPASSSSPARHWASISTPAFVVL
jgi:hypothetical protein